MTRKEAARQLGIPEGSVASRLARARALLAKRLARRGVVFSGPVATVLSGPASASAPPALVASTIKAASASAAGQAAVGVISVQVTDLTEGVLKAMMVSKIKVVLPVVLVAVLMLDGMGAGVSLSTNPMAVAQQPRGERAKERQPVPGKAVGVQQAPPTPTARLAYVATPDGRVRLIGPDLMAVADQILTVDNGRWEFIGSEQSPAGLVFSPGDPTKQEQWAGKRIIYSPDRGEIYISGLGVKHIRNRSRPDEKK